jgi:high-affinity iron transporter
VSFFDAEKMPNVAPQLAFHALTFGLSGTGMPSFDSLPVQRRWNLAFYVVGLRHGVPGQGKPSALASHKAVQALQLADLAEHSDVELCAKLVAGGLDAARCPEALAVLRTQAPFVTSVEGPLRFERARALLAELRVAVERGDHPAAQRLAIAAYLDGVEPSEATLRIEQPELLRRIEGSFMGLRQAVDPKSGQDAATVQRKISEAAGLLTEAERGSGGTVAAFVASLTIALREGLEVALLIAALLAFLRKSGQGHLTRLVHLGWLLAVPAGLLTFVAVGALVSGAQRELAEGLMTLLAAAILVTMTHWIIGAKEARHWLGFLRRRVEGAGEQAPIGQKLALIGLSFFAVYREAVEVVLFYRTLLVSAGPHGRSDVIWGAVLGVVVMIAVVLVVDGLAASSTHAGDAGEQCALGHAGAGDDRQRRACLAGRRLPGRDSGAAAGQGVVGRADAGAASQLAGGAGAVRGGGAAGRAVSSRVVAAAQRQSDRAAWRKLASCVSEADFS